MSKKSRFPDRVSIEEARTIVYERNKALLKETQVGKRTTSILEAWYNLQALEHYEREEQLPTSLQLQWLDVHNYNQQ